MKKITTSLYAIARHTYGGYTTKDKEYPVFKITKPSSGTRIFIINDKGNLEDWGASEFTFITK